MYRERFLDACEEFITFPHFLQFSILGWVIVEVLFHEPVTETKLISFFTVCHVVNVMQRFSGFLAIGSSNITRNMAFCYTWSWTVCYCTMLLFKFSTFLYNVSHCKIGAYIQGWERLFWTTLMFRINTEIRRSNNNITINEITIMFHIIYSVHCELNSKLYK
jgi:hypothetical protein